MGWRGATQAQSIVILVNAALRALQAVNGVTGIIFYANEKGYWLDHGLPDKIVRQIVIFTEANPPKADLPKKNFEFVLGAFAFLTGIVLCLIPFKFPYRLVTLACPWDFLMFLM
jgi:hypothetical protein